MEARASFTESGRPESRDVVSYSFGDFEVDLALFELRHQGSVVKIDPRAFNLLHYLLEHHDRVVPKEELLAEVWPDTAVTPGVLPTSIRRIRSALGQSARETTPIQTIYRRGYRLNMKVRLRARPCRRGSSPLLTAQPSYPS